MSGLTENGIIALNFSWIQQVCKSQHRALPYQERLSEGLIGFLYAVRTTARITKPPSEITQKHVCSVGLPRPTAFGTV